MFFIGRGRKIKFTTPDFDIAFKDASRWKSVSKFYSRSTSSLSNVLYFRCKITGGSIASAHHTESLACFNSLRLSMYISSNVTYMHTYATDK